MIRNLISICEKSLSSSILIVLSCLPIGGIATAQEEFKPLFNGLDFSGWEGSASLWRVEKGEIVGSTVDNPTKKNTFLIYRGEEVGDFHLKAKLRMTGENNSGIMYRAQDYDKYPFGLSGPQMDIHPKLEYQGMRFSERTGRGIIAERGQKVIVPSELNADGETTPKVVGDFGKTPQFNLSQWNDYEIIALGNRSIHKINGMVTVDVVDQDPSILPKGLIGFQLHAGVQMTIQVKDVALKALDETGGASAIEAAYKKHSSERRKQLEVGRRINENRATPVDEKTVADGFKVELLYSVPGDTQGSWINLALNGKNRLIASDQFGGLYRFPAPAAGEVLDPSLVKAIPVDMKAVNGLLWAFDSLYVGVNDYRDKERSGLYRITDTDGDDELDHVELLRKIKSRGDHGVHGLRLSPDGKSIFLICGNYAELTDIDSSRVPMVQTGDIGDNFFQGIALILVLPMSPVYLLPMSPVCTDLNGQVA
ncbi:MAG: hypothetical protein ACI92G_000025 [Candidatus Pelagisphaera sp.]|jgi:hypothetical protein